MILGLLLGLALGAGTMLAIADRVTRRERRKVRIAVLQTVGKRDGPKAAVDLGTALRWIEYEETGDGVRIRIR